MLTQETYWDKVAEEKEFTTPFQMELFKKNVSEKAKILDIGCGYGRTLNQLYLSGFPDLTGVDISKNMINRGNKLYPYLNIQTSDANGIPFDDNSFDAVVLMAVLTCVVNDDEQEQLINEVHRVLRDNGVLYINDFLINNDQRNIDRYKQYEAKYKNYGTFELQEKEGVSLRHFAKMRIDELTCSFKNIVFEPVIYTTMNGNQSNGFYYLGRK
ncbi:MAG: class I SAM-dependent methyltransferase [Desulfobacteraceae bacterium]|nr:class I SAM-dependent methyltransferase [Desulfobacteraceae bacterium]